MTMQIRMFRPGDEAACYHVCLQTGDHGKDGEPFYREDPDALGRIYVGPYLRFAPELALILEDEQGVCGYSLGAFDSKKFYHQYETRWRPELAEQFPEPTGDKSTWSRIDEAHHLYHHPDYFCPDPYDLYPSHLHIDLTERAQGKGHGRKIIQRLLELLREQGSVGVHLGMSITNDPAYGFYRTLGFEELIRDQESIYMGMRFVAEK
jgi:ribosomal protein S18 acetylase RimI-like enzyme